MRVRKGVSTRVILILVMAAFAFFFILAATGLLGNFSDTILNLFLGIPGAGGGG